jgi:hypothetical protein
MVDSVGVVVIACYRPKPGKEAALLAETRAHWSTLRSEGLVTDRIPIIARAADGTVACDYVPIAEVPEATQLFSSFTPLHDE